MRSRRFTFGVAVLAVAAGAVLAAPRLTDSDLFGSSQAAATDTSNESFQDFDLATVSRQNLEEKSELNGSVGFGGEVSLPIEASGIVTDAPESGSTLVPGDTVVTVAGKPVVLAQGSQPLFRDLRRIASGERDSAGDKVGLLKGDDVTQLQEFLLSQGFDDKGRLVADGTFGLTTERAVKAWQRDVGHPATGTVDRSQLVFTDSSIRVESVPTVGQQFDAVSVTSTTPKISGTASAKNRQFFAVGTKVALEGANGSATGTVSSQKRTVTNEGSTGYLIEIDLDGSSAEPFAASESVKIVSSRTVAKDALTVPVRALIALAEGGWAVQVDTVSGPQLTAVSLGEVVDGFAEIEGLEEGSSVVVPL